MGGRRKRWARLAVSATLIAAATTAPSGCSSSGSGCRPVTVGIATPHIADIKAAFDIDTTIAASGHPLSGVSVEFWAWGAPPGETSSVGTELGTAVSGADGTAVFHEPALGPGTVAGMAANLTGNYLVRVSADVAAVSIAGQAYCGAKGRAPITDCGASGCLIKA